MKLGRPTSNPVRTAVYVVTIGLLATVSSLAMGNDGPSLGSPQATTGAIIGIVTNKDNNLPVPRATVTAVREDGGSFHAVLSGNDGSFSFSDLAPGKWSITSHLDGYPDAPVLQVEVVASKATRHDIAMNAPGITPAPLIAAAPAVPPPAPAPAAAPAPTVPLALTAPEPAPEPDNETPFAFGDFTWLNGNPRNHAPAFDTKFFTPDIRFDADLFFQNHHPSDHTIDGSTEVFRSGEVQLTQISVGGDFHWDNVKARVLPTFGMYSTTIPRNDASSGNIGGVGQWDLQNAYRYVTEANVGYHWDHLVDTDHGFNIDAGIFASYIGLFSFYNYDNWTYQPSYVSSNTPWIFNGIRFQWYPTNNLKIEPWLINGWASYARFNSKPGFGGQVLWRPTENLDLVFNNYGVGTDNLQNFPYGEVINGIRVNYTKTTRIHTDDSIQYKYYDNPAGGAGITKAAFSLTLDAGCQFGGGVSCYSGPNKSQFLGWMAYNRIWFNNDKMAVTVGGGSINNPGRYLVLLPPINGATASTGTPYFSTNPGDVAKQWDVSLNFQYMPKEWITWWTEVGYRHSNIPYWVGPDGITPPYGNNGSPANYTCNSGSSSGFGAGSLASAEGACGGQGGVWFPNLVKSQATLGFGILVKF